MDDELQTIMPTAGSADRFPAGGRFIAALAGRDFTALAGCLDPGVRLRALLPPGPVDASGSDTVTEHFRFWFGWPAEVNLIESTVGEVGSRLYLRWRLRLIPDAPADPVHIVEQHAFVTAGERITELDVLCSGFMPEPPDTGGAP